MAAGISFADKLCVVFSLNSETKYTWQSGLREQHIQLILVLTDFNSSAEKVIDQQSTPYEHLYLLGVVRVPKSAKGIQISA